MFIGYQNNIIAFVAETREELENMPCVTLDKIEETSEEYVLHNGSYILKSEADTMQADEDKQARISELKAKLAETDYKIIKCYEASMLGQELPYNLEELVAERNEWRAEISNLGG